MARKRVLVTGMSGLLGTAVRARLERGYELTALNRRDVPGTRTIRADVGDLHAIRPAFEGQDVVVHLAGYRGYDWESLLRANIVGLYNVFEASREAGVKRIVFASSGATFAGWQRSEPYRAIVEGLSGEVPASLAKLGHLTLPKPAGIYGCTKVWGEALAWDYAETFALSILCLRFGSISESDRPTTRAMVPGWCSQRDAAQMVERCIEAPPGLKYDIFNVISNNRWSVRDLSHARDTVGYSPMDSAGDHPMPD